MRGLWVFRKLRGQDPESAEQIEAHLGARVLRALTKPVKGDLAKSQDGAVFRPGKTRWERETGVTGRYLQNREARRQDNRGV